MTSGGEIWLISHVAVAREIRILFVDSAKDSQILQDTLKFNNHLISFIFMPEQ